MNELGTGQSQITSCNMQQISEEKSSSGSAKDLSVQINYLNDLLEKGAISEEEYDRRAERLRHVGEVIGYD